MKKRTVNPSTLDMKEEVRRRWDAFVAPSLADNPPPPATKYWDKKQLEQWLCNHPITGIEDVTFLRSVIAERKKTAENAKKNDEEWEAEQPANTGATVEGKKHKKWSGNKVYQRLMQALVDFADIKYA